LLSEFRQVQLFAQNTLPLLSLEPHACLQSTQHPRKRPIPPSSNPSTLLLPLSPLILLNSSRASTRPLTTPSASVTIQTGRVAPDTLPLAPATLLDAGKALITPTRPSSPFLLAVLVSHTMRARSSARHRCRLTSSVPCASVSPQRSLADFS
jgi:hypothetical protein